MIHQEADVLVLCGGKGLRLRPMVGRHPKPLALVDGRPLLDRILYHWHGFGFRRFVLCVGYRAAVFRRHYENQRCPFTVIFSEEPKPLGTGGALRHAQSLIRSKDFFVLNGDTYFNLDPGDLMAFHRAKKAAVSLALSPLQDKDDCGNVSVNKSGRITEYAEKSGTAQGRFVNAGVYVFGRKALDLLPRAEKFSLEEDFFPTMTTGAMGTSGTSQRLFGWVAQNKFWDIGTPQRYMLAARQIQAMEKGSA